ncbi:MAG: DUF1501 domain-containing protein [Pirellulaceae bacterium]
MNQTFKRNAMSRRDFVRIGGLTAFGVGPSALMAAQANSKQFAAGRAKSCILVWLAGGPSHIETFDPKPDAPEEVRGPLSSIATTLPGVPLCETLPATAAIMDRISIVRSVTSPLGEHNFGTHYMMTGYKPTPVLEYPAFGSTLAAVRAPEGVLPQHVAVPNFVGGVSGNGYLPTRTKPFGVGGDPRRPEFKVRDLDFYHGLDLTRLGRRKQMLNAFDQFERELDAASTAPKNSELERAFNLIASKDAKAAFELSAESAETRQRYGMGDAIGQSCLLARRLVEHGVPFVTVNNSGWDTHQNIVQLKERFPGDKNAKALAFDRAFSALVTDLDERHMLDSTLVIAMGEFGRTPKINVNGGRDHWPNVFSVALAGGGIKRGYVHGSSDTLAEYPADNAVTPADLAATIYSLLGINPAHELHTNDGRPVRVAHDTANVISELIS